MLDDALLGMTSREVTQLLTDLDLSKRIQALKLLGKTLLVCRALHAAWLPPPPSHLAGGRIRRTSG